MGMTMTQKILSAHIKGTPNIKAGELVMADLDLVLGHDLTAPIAINEYEKAGLGQVFDACKVCLVMDHFTPNKDIKAAEQTKQCRDFAKKQNIDKFFDTGEVGVEHVLLPEKGLVTAGDLVIGADSHTCTYGAIGALSSGVGSTDMAAAMAYGKLWFKVPSAVRFNLFGKPSKWVSGKDVILHIIGMIGVDGALYKSMEFVGEGIKHLSMDDRFTICNMAIEAGGKNGIFPIDEKTLAYLKESGAETPKVYEADSDAVYEKTYDIDLSKIEPTVAFPHLPSNTKTFGNFEKIEIDQVVIGSCTNGRFSDFESAAKVLGGKKVKKGVRALVLPTTPKVYMQLLDSGLLKLFLEAGCAVTAPTCGPCLGGHSGILAKGERCASTTNRNFVGRMGHPESEVYLVNPAVAAASAVMGYIAHPDEVCEA